jgi:catechol 2,3-dioxygenase-like lactoylglutathione lyase family enzyme
MSPAERPLEDATIDHFALSVADLDTMVAFYTRIGFDERTRSDLAPAPVRVVLLRNTAGAAIELTAHQASLPLERPRNPIDAATHQGQFHVAIRVEKLDSTIVMAVTAGASLITPPAMNSRGDTRFAYLADPEGNLIELVSPAPPADDESPSLRANLRT